MLNDAKAVGYVRVSTQQQAEKGISLEAQTEKIRAMAIVQDVELLEVITDAAESAKSMDRPGLIRLLSLVDAGRVETVIITKLDRLTRSVKDLGILLERFQKKGVALVSLAESLDTNSAAGRLVINIMMSVSQWEREVIGERTQTALQHKKAHRKVFNHVPYGYIRQGDDLLPVIQEQAVIGRVRSWREERWTLRQIADVLNGEAVPTKLGGRWHAQTVKDVLDNGLHQRTELGSAA
jgi:site-specific DNA recombinase